MARQRSNEVNQRQMARARKEALRTRLQNYCVRAHGRVGALALDGVDALFRALDETAAGISSPLTILRGREIVQLTITPRLIAT